MVHRVSEAFVKDLFRFVTFDRLIERWFRPNGVNDLRDRVGAHALVDRLFREDSFTLLWLAWNQLDDGHLDVGTSSREKFSL